MRRGGLRRILPSGRSCCAKPKLIAMQRLSVGIVRKRDQGRKTGAAFRAMPNVTRAVFGPILGPHRGNQVSAALDATHGDPHSPPETRSDYPLQTTSKLRITCGPPLMWGLNQWIGGVAGRLSCSARMRRDGLRRISRKRVMLGSVTVS